MAKKILSLIVAISVIGLLVWAIHDYAELPVVEFSVSQQRVVAVRNWKGEALPLYPLPKKYKPTIYVK